MARVLKSPDDHSDAEKEVLKNVRGKQQCSARFRRQFEPRWDQWYGLRRNYRRFARARAQAVTPRDKDEVTNELLRSWGDDLFVPMAFVVIETNVPRILATDPTLNVKPLNAEAEQAVEPVRELFHRDMGAMKYGRRLQETVRSGLCYGLGVQKLYWKRETRDRRKVKPGIMGIGRRVTEEQVVLFEGPMAESRDIRDFYWDPAAWDIESCAYVIDRTWRSTEYVEARMSGGEWTQVDPEVLKKSGSNSKRGEIWSGRFEASGLIDFEPQGNDEHQVWEFWDRENVYTVLDETYLVKEQPNPFLHGDLPFQIFRPTLVEHEFVGIGEVEPIAHLLYELNSLRGQRRDAATLALNRGYIYQAGTLDESTFRTGIGVLNPVFGVPSEIIQPMPFSDIPQSGVSEEESIKADIELTSAMAEAVTGAGGEETATATQLVQAAATLRIKQKAKNLHEDLLRPATAQMHELYLQHIVKPEQVQPVRIEDPRTPTGFSYMDVGPEQLEAKLEISPKDGSTEPDDAVQQRQQSIDLLTALAPFAEDLEVEKVLGHVLFHYGVDDPKSWLKQGPQPDQIVEGVGHAMKEAGIPEEQILQILRSAAPGGPPLPQAAESNGAAPQPEPTTGG